MGNSSNSLARASYRGIKALGALRRFVCSARIRSQVITRMRYKAEHLQGETFTCEDRYPELFEECRRRLAGVAAPRILCYGCATGEEVFSLARYMPQAEILGVDINHWCLAQCAKRNSSGKLRFAHRMSKEFAEAAEFDAIFAMAVFQRTEHRTAGAGPADTGFTFEHFEAETAMLDGKLKAGGLLFLDHCDFVFEQTRAGAGHEPAEFAGNRAPAGRAVFGRDNRLMAEEHVPLRCFVKR
jgi:hypothetical protein